MEGKARARTRPAAELRFYAELNDFLPVARRAVPFRATFDEGATVKDLVESIGVPHPEIDLILANGESVDFGYRVHDRDRISVYPVFEALDISPVVRLRPAPLRQPRFVLDGHLGRLARYLRLLGFDCAYRNDPEDAELVRVSRGEGRVLLTRDVGLLKRSAVTRGSFVRATVPRRQVVEVLRRFDLLGAVQPFTRCLTCNGQLQAVAKEVVEHRLLAGTRRDHEEFWRCPECERVYWRGSHYGRLTALVSAIQAEGE